MDYKDFIVNFIDALRYNDWETLEYLEDECPVTYHTLLECFIFPTLSAACKAFLDD